MNFDQFSEITRQLVSHEDSLGDQRLNWLITSQSVLYAALAFIWDKSWVVAVVISLVGVISCISIGGALLTNTAAIRKILDDWQQEKPNGHIGPRVIALRSQENPYKWSPPLYPWNILPWVLAVSWLITLVLRLFEVFQGA